MKHRIAGSEAGSDGAANDGVNTPIGERQKIQAWIAHRLTPRRIYLEQVQHLVGANRKDDDRDKAQEQGAGASPQAARRGIRVSSAYAHSGQRRSALRLTSEKGISALLAWPKMLSPSLEVIVAQSI